MKIIDIIKLLVIVAIIYLIINSFIGQKKIIEPPANTINQDQEKFTSEPDQELLYLDNEIIIKI